MRFSPGLRISIRVIRVIGGLTPDVLIASPIIGPRNKTTDFADDTDEDNRWQMADDVVQFDF